MPQAQGMTKRDKMEIKSMLNHWVTHHDSSWSFIVLYVGGAVLLSVFTNLFWVALLMFGHLLLEIWRHVVIQAKNPVLQALWHVKLDIALILFALVIALYAEMVLAALGIGQAARAGQAVRGAQMLTRFAIIERGLRIFFMTVDDMARIGHILWKIARGQKIGAGTADAVIEDTRTQIRDEDTAHGRSGWRRLSGGDIFSLSFGAICVVLILLAPHVTGRGVAGTASFLWAELQP